MWNRVKGDNLSTGVVIFLILVVLCVIAYGAYIISKNSRRKTMSKKRR